MQTRIKNIFPHHWHYLSLRSPLLEGVQFYPGVAPEFFQKIRRTLQSEKERFGLFLFPDALMIRSKVSVAQFIRKTDLIFLAQVPQGEQGW